MFSQKINQNFSVVTTVLGGLILCRFLPHPPNFTPILSAGLVGGVFLGRHYFAWLIPLVAMFLSDLVLGMHGTVWFVYGSIFAATCLGRSIGSDAKPASLILASIAASLIFFVTTNFGVWLLSGLYPQNQAGLLACYSAALPFFIRTLVSTVGYTLVATAAVRLFQQRLGRMSSI